MNWQPISEQVWDGIRAEFTLPAVGQVHQRLSELMEDPEPVMQQLVRVFLSGLNRLCRSSEGQYRSLRSAPSVWISDFDACSTR